MITFHRCLQCKRGVCVEQDFDPETRPFVRCLQCTCHEAGMLTELVKEVKLSRYDRCLHEVSLEFDRQEHRRSDWGCCVQRFKCEGGCGCGKEVTVQYGGSYDKPPKVSCTCHLELWHPDMKWRPMTPVAEKPKPKKLTPEEEFVEVKKELSEVKKELAETREELKDMNERVEWLELRFHNH